MSRSFAAFALSAALSVVPVLAQAPPPPATPPASAADTSAALPPPPQPASDPLEPILWQGAATANTAAAYATYLNRYPDGFHAEDARAAIDQLKRSPPPVEAPAPAPAAASTTPPLSPATEPAPAAQAAEEAPFVCRPVFAGEPPFEQAAEAEIAAYLQAVRVNALGSYQTYLAAYPHGVFAPEVAEAVAARQGRMSALAKLGGPGPAQARARAQIAPAETDYPSIALRDAQQGKATAIWEIAEDGCVEACRIDKSSGSAALDSATCRMITLRGRYDPALSPQGKPVRSVDSATFTWKLPQH